MNSLAPLTDAPGIGVLAAPLIDPEQGRIEIRLPAGGRLSDIVLEALPNLPADAPVRLLLVSENGVWPVDRSIWHLVRPSAGTKVVIRVLPGKDALRSVLQVVVTLAAVALGQIWAAPLAGFLGVSTQVAGSLISLGVTAVGNLLINALVPPPQTNTGQQSNGTTYTISGWRNRIDPDGRVPCVLGRIRWAPFFGAMSYTEIVGDLQYVRALFLIGEGEHELSGYRLGETDLEEYDEVEVETRLGLETDLPVTLYPRQVIEEAGGAELVRPWPRDDAGNPITNSGPPIETPVVRVTARDAQSASVILQFPAGLFTVGKKGTSGLDVDVRIRQRPAGTEVWQDVITLNIRARKTEGFFRQHSWDLPVRGRWEVEITRMTGERTESESSDRCVLMAFQSIRPEYPLNFDRPLALVALRVKATYQLNGSLDNFNLEAGRVCEDWDSATQSWVRRVSRNPASVFRHVLQSQANAWPVADSGIDLDTLADWHAFCADKGLEYNEVHSDDMSLGDVLKAVASAGRAYPRHDGLKWSVVIDRPQTLAVDHISPRNSSQFRWSWTYFDPPHAFRVKFSDETNFFEPAERLVPWPGHAGEITRTEEIELPGKTNPDEIWVEARRRQYELQYRRGRYSCLQDGAARVGVRGDLVLVSHDILTSTQGGGRVLSIRGALVELDEVVTMAAGGQYGIRYRAGVTDEDTIGWSEIREVEAIAGTHRALILKDASEPLPTVGWLVHFGPLGNVSSPMIVRGVESAEDLGGAFTLVDAAPEIDVLTDAEEPPLWNGRVGAEIDPALLAPAVPVFTGISSGIAGTGEANGLTVLLTPGTGSPAVVVSYQISHRLSGAGSWSVLSATAADGGAQIAGYLAGDVVEIKALAVALGGTPGPETNVVTVTIGAGDEPVPGTLSGEIAVEGGLGSAVITVATPADASIAAIQIYRVPSGNALDRETHAAGNPIAAEPSTTLQKLDGDGTRVNLISNGGFDDGGSWTLGSGWSIAAGRATHAAGSAADLAQAAVLETGAVYRLAYQLGGVSGGSLTPRLSGGAGVAAPAASASGVYSAELSAISGSTGLAFAASSSFAGSVLEAALYRQSATAIPSGLYDYYAEPLNADGVAGPVAGPFPALIL